MPRLSIFGRPQQDTGMEGPERNTQPFRRFIGRDEVNKRAASYIRPVLAGSPEKNSPQGSPPAPGIVPTQAGTPGMETGRPQPVTPPVPPSNVPEQRPTGVAPTNPLPSSGLPNPMTAGPGGMIPSVAPMTAGPGMPGITPMVAGPGMGQIPPQYSILPQPNPNIFTPTIMNPTKSPF